MYNLVIIDDEQKILDGMVNLFPWEEIGFTVAAQFTSPVKAEEYIQKNPVDVVLTDIEMPGMNGLELCSRLSKNRPVKLVLFSSYQNYRYLRSAIQLSVVDYILKPVKYSELLSCFARIREALDGEREKETETPRGYYEKIVADTVEYLNRNYQNASLEEAAERVNLSPSYLSKIFKEKSGSSFSDTLSTIRMNKGREMLDDPQYKSYEIAYYLGYDNPKNFSRAFKAYFHMSPSEYRNRKEKGDG